MAFIYNLTDSWNDVATTWNGIKLAVTNSGSDASSKLLNLTVTGATTASFVVDKSGNLALNGTVNKITITAPATGATLTLADGSTFATSGAYSTTFTTTGTTTLTLPTSGTVTALGNTTTGTGNIVRATSPTLVTPLLGTPTSGTLTNCTGLPLSTGTTGTLAVSRGGTGITSFGTGVATALGQNVTGSGGIVLATSATLITPNLGTPSTLTLTNATSLPISGISATGTPSSTTYLRGDGIWSSVPGGGGGAGTVTSTTLTDNTLNPTFTPPSDNFQQVNIIAGYTAGISTVTIASPSGTPTDGQRLVLRLYSTNTNAVTLSFTGSNINGSTDITLPASMSANSKYDYLGLMWNAASSKWNMVSRVQGFA